MARGGKVFLGGTMNGSTWRQDLIKNLKMPYFNPEVAEWTYAAQVNEIRQKSICAYHLYVITPKMDGVFSIAELVDGSNKDPGKTIACFLKSDDTSEFDESQWKSIQAVARLVQTNGVRCFHSLDRLANFFNT